MVDNDNEASSQAHHIEDKHHRTETLYPLADDSKMPVRNFRA